MGSHHRHCAPRHSEPWRRTMPPPPSQRFRSPYPYRYRICHHHSRFPPPPPPPPLPPRWPQQNPYHNHDHHHDHHDHHHHRPHHPPPPRLLPTSHTVSPLPSSRRPPTFLSLDRALPTPRGRRSDDSVQHSDLGSTTHNRNRRFKRGISTVDLKKARRYGMKEYGHMNRLKYTFQGKVLIWDPRRNKAITCWNLETSNKSKWAGTFKTLPIMIQKLREFETPDCLWLHNEARRASLLEKEKWTSHTVLVVDMSGSMRQDDVDGARCRSDAVWTCLARDFVRAKIEQHAAISRASKINLRYEMVSVVLMRDQAQVVLHCEPTDYVLYNRLVDLREWTNERPQGHGYYLPALKQAEALLNINPIGSCTLQLFFCSDGRPSDRDTNHLTAAMGMIASRFGRRLTVTCLGMAAPQEGEDFSVLRHMAEEAKEYGAVAHLHVPTLLTAESISKIVAGHVTSSLSLSVSELADPRTGHRLVVRSDLFRERRSSDTAYMETPDQVNWRIFSGRNGNYTVRVWKWNEKNNDICRLIDPRCVSCLVTVVNPVESNHATVTPMGHICGQCNACFLCQDCSRHPQKRHPDHECHRFAEERRQGAIVSEFVPSFQVAWKHACFGEGAERVAFKFRYLSQDGILPIGPTMVAKESRFVGKQDQLGLTRHQHQYHLNFVRAQHLASKHAEAWNGILQQMQDTATNELDRSVIRKYPRIRFVQPYIFELSEGGKTHSVLVEELIKGRFRKFNTNCAGGRPSELLSLAPQHQRKPSTLDDRFVDMLVTSAKSTPPSMQPIKLETVQEDDGDNVNDDDDASDDEVLFMKTEKPINDEVTFIKVVKTEMHAAKTFPSVPDHDFMNAFSHFTYIQSSGRHMVVDLQGNLSIHQDGFREFIMTDPAIHTMGRGGTNFYGRTDRGKRGIQSFLKTHKCNGACRIFELNS